MKDRFDFREVLVAPTEFETQIRNAVLDACWPWNIGYVNIYLDDSSWPVIYLIVEVQNHYSAKFKKRVTPIMMDGLEIAFDVQECCAFFRNLERVEPEDNVWLGEN